METTSSFITELKKYSNGAAFMTSAEFGKFYGCTRDTAQRKLKAANLERHAGGKYRVASIAWKLERREL